MTKKRHHPNPSRACRSPSITPAGTSDDRAVVSESLLIVVYVDEAFHGPPLLPADPHERTLLGPIPRRQGNKPLCIDPPASWSLIDRARDSVHLMKSTLLALVSVLGAAAPRAVRGGRRSAGGVHGGGGGAAQGDGQEVPRRRRHRPRGHSRRRAAGVLEEVAGARVMIMSDEEEYPALRRWAAAYISDEAVKGCLPEKARLLAYFAAVRDKCVSVANSMAMAASPK
ncbi:hypothetical protein U9M48_016507 [Paspalum notatum var. saurae]|uniref:Uncharacterized protein n=1 Tax=Paspalum notatum var. saurae TaxID=547442 RepID=A0AAQ3T7Q6_PASNO